MGLVRKSTPVLVVAAVEPSLGFFEKLGFSCSVSVPHEDRIGFAILNSGSVELMLQSEASVAADIGEQHRLGRDCALFLEVENLDQALAVTAGAAHFFERRTTFYGATEVGVIEPGGHHITLAQFAVEQDAT